jgi:hypothetical protein
MSLVWQVVTLPVLTCGGNEGWNTGPIRTTAKKHCLLKGTVPRDFRLHVFFMNQFATGVFDTGGKFTAGVVDTCGAP